MKLKVYLMTVICLLFDDILTFKIEGNEWKTEKKDSWSDFDQYGILKNIVDINHSQPLCCASFDHFANNFLKLHLFSKAV